MRWRYALSNMVLYEQSGTMVPYATHVAPWHLLKPAMCVTVLHPASMTWLGQAAVVWDPVPVSAAVPASTKTKTRATAQVVAADGVIYMVLEYGDIDLARLLAKQEAARRDQHATGAQPDENFIRLYWQQMLQARARATRRAQRADAAQSAPSAHGKVL